MTALETSTPVAVIGAGTMGAGIVQVAATAGHNVYLYDTSPDAVDRGVAQIEKFLSRSVEKGRMEEADKQAILARIHKCTDLQALSPARLVIEAIIEDLDIKQKLFGDLEDILPEDAILATNTSSISVTAIAAGLKRPERLVGMHFFNPAPLMKLVEVICGLVTDAAVADTVFETATNWGKDAVHAKSTPGFIVNRVARPFYAEALRLVQENIADIPTIDACIREAGNFPMGPFQLMDLIGNDINFSVTKSVYNAYFQDPRYRPSLIQQEQVAAGRLGRKSGRGYYDYSPDAQNSAPHTAEAAPAPNNVIRLGKGDLLGTLSENIETRESEFEGFEIGDMLLLLTDGRTATELSKTTGKDVVVFDLALNYAAATRIAIAKGDQASDSALETACGFFQARDKQVSIIDDGPGLILMRMVAMLASEANDAVYQGVASEADVNTAMEKGVNYPKGPLTWAREIGHQHISHVLGALYEYYGEDRYRVPPRLRRQLNGEQS